MQIVESTKAAWNKSREDVSKIHVDLVESTGLAVDGMAWSCDNISSRLQDLSKTHDSFLASMAEVEKLRFEQGQQRLHIVKMNSRKMIEETKSAVSKPMNWP